MTDFARRLDAGGRESAMALMIAVLALLAFVLAANAIVASAAISKLEEPRGPSSLLKKVFDPERHASLIQKSTFHRTIDSRGAPTRFFSFGHFEAVRLFQQTARS
jgi:hypothetical protein